MNPQGKRIGILGGAFNPPHAGHLRLAELGLQSLGLDEVRFIPTDRSPHKATDGPAGRTRLELLVAMLEASGQPFRADAVELERGGVSYTVDTLERLSALEPECHWILLVGSDQLPGLSSWWRLDRILELASIAVAPRPGHETAVGSDFQGRLRDAWSGVPGEVIPLPGTHMDLASSRLRRDLAEGKDPKGLPIQVRDAIYRENLYR